MMIVYEEFRMVGILYCYSAQKVYIKVSLRFQKGTRYYEKQVTFLRSIMIYNQFDLGMTYTIFLLHFC